MSRAKVFFPNLNAIRFIAALLVIVTHYETFRTLFGHQNFGYFDRISGIMGRAGVILFFVLSGFLITYLLFAEEKQNDSIAIKDFYIRRMLRIWPLYFFVVGLAFFVFPHLSIINEKFFDERIAESFWSKIALYFTLFPNLAIAIFGPIYFIGPTWSIGTEEQFYLVWPWVMKKLKKNREVIFIAIILGYMLIKLCLPSLQSYIPIWFVGYYLMCPVDCLVMGAGTAWIMFHNKVKLKAILFHPFVQYLSIVAVSVFILKGYRFTLLGAKFNMEAYAVCFSIIIANAACNPRRIFLFNLENSVTNYLGKISYGLYMYHPIAIYFTLKACHRFGIVNNITALVLCLLCTIAIASISYRFLEEKFLRLKPKFSKIDSGENARAI